MYEKIYTPYPTLAHDNTGKVRIRFGEKDTQSEEGDLCSFESDEGVLEFDTWQYLTVSYNGTQFFVYINGELIDNGGGSGDCLNQSSPSDETTLYVGNSSNQGYLWLAYLRVTWGADNSGRRDSEELRINVDGDNLWYHNDIDNDGAYYAINKGYVLDEAKDYIFRL